MVNLEGKLTEICKLNLESICATPIVSPDSKRIAYPIRSTKWFSQGMKVCINGSTQKHYQAVSGLVFSPDSQHLAHVAIKRNGMVIVLDGGEISQEYDDISLSTPIFSPDSEHIAFGARRGSKWFAVKDGVEEESHDGFVAGSMVFSPDSRLAYGYYVGSLSGRLQLGGKIIVVSDGTKKAEYDKAKGESMVERSLKYSPDSKILVYGAERNGKFFAVIDGKEESPHDKTSQEIFFSPNSRHVGYFAINNNLWSLVMDGKKHKEYDSIGIHAFSPDSQHFAYKAVTDSDQCIVLDGQEKRKYMGVLDHFIGFSPDSQHFVYGAEWGANQFAVLDGMEQKEYLGIPQIPLSFSPNSKYLVYATTQNNQNMLIVVNDGELDMGINLVIGANFVFDSPNKFHTLVTSRNKIYRLDVEIR